jgi:hypothetical protein
VSIESAARVRLLRLQQEILAEAATLEKLSVRLRRAAEADGASLPDEARWAVLAVSLHGYYGAAESALLRICRTVDDDVPSGAEWHKDLLLTASRPLGEIRGAVISEASRATLTILLGFRHFFRHAYAADFDGAKLLDHASRTLASHPTLVTELEAFARQLLD